MFQSSQANLGMFTDRVKVQSIGKWIHKTVSMSVSKTSSKVISIKNQQVHFKT